MSERENLAAGIYAAIITSLMMFCLLGAFLLPASVFQSRWLAFIGIGGFLGIPLLLRLADRSRIHDAVRQLGGTVVRIRKLPFWRQVYVANRYAFYLGTRYRVEYQNHSGATHYALCCSGFFQGVEWLEDLVADESC